MIVTEVLRDTFLRVNSRRRSYKYKTKEGSLILVLGLAVLLVGLILSRCIDDEEKSKKVGNGFFCTAAAIIAVSVVVDSILAGKY